MPAKQIGVYKIQSITFSNRFYIGSSVNIQRRFKTHIHRLKTHTHENKKLQNHADKYGVSDLQFTIVFSCSLVNLVTIEQHHLNTMLPSFNILKTCHPGSYKKSDITTRQKIAASWKHRKPIPMFSRLCRQK